MNSLELSQRTYWEERRFVRGRVWRQGREERGRLEERGRWRRENGLSEGEHQAESMRRIREETCEGDACA